MGTESRFRNRQPISRQREDPMNHVNEKTAGGASLLPDRRHPGLHFRPFALRAEGSAWGSPGRRGGSFQLCGCPGAWIEAPARKLPPLQSTDSGNARHPIIPRAGKQKSPGGVSALPKLDAFLLTRAISVYSAKVQNPDESSGSISLRYPLEIAKKRFSLQPPEIGLLRKALLPTRTTRRPDCLDDLRTTGATARCCA